VRALLMGGQACVLYGAAEFSRDTDFAILASPANLERLRAALSGLEAEQIAVPPLELGYLLRGHAVHFRCRAGDAAGLRIDVMSRLRGCDPFAKLWARKTTVRLADHTEVDVLSLPDLVRAKKTQRDKDWPMLRRLLEAHYFANRARPRRAHPTFWMLELRTAELLVEAAGRWPAARAACLRRRALLSLATPGREGDLGAALLDEERSERQADEEYWRPLKAELERLRHRKARERRSAP
jgi:hypothetical protein